MKLLKAILQKICRFLELCRIKEETDVYPDVIEDMRSMPDLESETDPYQDIVEDTGIVPDPEK